MPKSLDQVSSDSVAPVQGSRCQEPELCKKRYPPQVLQANEASVHRPRVQRP
jgi:hypothetical protein